MANEWYAKGLEKMARRLAKAAKAVTAMNVIT